jgi:hypothetical protein
MINKKYLNLVLGSSVLWAAIGLTACNQNPIGSNSNASDQANLSANLDDIDKGRLNQVGRPPANANPGLRQIRRVEAGQGKHWSEGGVHTRLGPHRIKGVVPVDIKDSELGVTIRSYQFESGTDLTGNGAEDQMATGLVAVSGLAQHRVRLEQENFDLMSNEDDILTVYDETLSNIRTYHADQDLFNYTLSDGQQELRIETLPNGTWLVNGEPAATPKAVARLAMKSPVLADASLHGLMLVYQLFNHSNKVPIEVQELPSLGPIGTADTEIHASELGDPMPLLKAAIELKKAEGKPGRSRSGQAKK